MLVIPSNNSHHEGVFLLKADKICAIAQEYFYQKRQQKIGFYLKIAFCPITNKLIENPIFAPNGKMYERDALISALEIEDNKFTFAKDDIANLQKCIFYTSLRDTEFPLMREEINNLEGKLHQLSTEKHLPEEIKYKTSLLSLLKQEKVFDLIKSYFTDRLKENEKTLAAQIENISDKKGCQISYCCPLTEELTLIDDPVVALDGHTYEREKLKEYAENKLYKSRKTSQEFSYAMGEIDKLPTNILYRQIAQEKFPIFFEIKSLRESITMIQQNNITEDILDIGASYIVRNYLEKELKRNKERLMEQIEAYNSPAYLCGISLSVPRNPVIGPDGYLYEKETFITYCKEEAKKTAPSLVLTLDKFLLVLKKTAKTYQAAQLTTLTRKHSFRRYLL